jgi:processing peptidase subunit alpha
MQARKFASAAVPVQESIMERIFATSKMPVVSMSSPFPGVSVPVDAAPKTGVSAVQISTLSNGVKVVSQDSSCPGATIGVYVAAGSRFESAANAGTAHFIERLAFKGTTNRTAFRLVRDLSRLGSNSRSALTRESIGYVHDGLRSAAPQFVEYAADMARNPQFDLDDVARAKIALDHDLEVRHHDSASIMDNAFHSAAFSGETLGRSLQAGAKAHQTVTLEGLKAFHAQQFHPSRVVLAGVGCAHEDLVKLADKYMSGTWGSGAAAPAKAAAVYTGGQSIVEASHDDGLTHVMLGWKAPSWNDSDLVTAAVLNLMMGGGGSFSSGGPGKGMYSRMYLNVLNKYNWINYANAVSSPYSDSGLFGFYFQAPADKTTDCLQVMTAEAKKMTVGAADAELARAKTQLSSMIHFNLESRATRFEDLGSQVLSTGKYQSASEISAQIEKVSAADVARVAKQMLSSPLTYVVSSENATKAPRYDQVEKMLQ